MRGYAQCASIGLRHGQRIERQVICKAPEGEPRISFRRLANHMPFSFLTRRSLLGGTLIFQCMKITISMAHNSILV